MSDKNSSFKGATMISEINQYRYVPKLNGPVWQSIGLKVLVLMFATCFIGCKKLVDVNPPVTSINGPIVFSSDATAISVLTGLYSKISGASYFSEALVNLGLYGGLSADELTLWSGITDLSPKGYYTNNLFSNLNTSAGTAFWTELYSDIFICNNAISEIDKSAVLTPVIKQQLLGEAKFVRAYLYFYLVNLYGDVPLVLNTDYKQNSVVSRKPETLIYQQIIADLKDAQGLLNTNYPDITLLKETTERVRPTKWAATALLARTYLYTKDWVNAEKEASDVINNSSLYSLKPLNDVFLANSQEAIWQLQPVNGYNTNTPDAKIFILPDTGPNNDFGGNPVYLNSLLLNSFESGDQRRKLWIDSVKIGNDILYYPYKYKVNTPNAPVTEYLMMLRLAEQYMIRAEARAQQEKIQEAQNDLNMVRNRAGLPNTTANEQATLLAAIFHERQVELFTEAAHRWFDLKRSGKVDEVMSVVTPLKGGNWQTADHLYPLPITDIQRDPNLVQNPNY